MKIRVAFFDEDVSYLNRISNTLNMRYADSLQVYAFSDSTAAKAFLSDTALDVVLASHSFGITKAELPPNTSFAFLTESQNAASIEGSPAISKYQKVDLIYKHILNLFADGHDLPLGGGDGGSTDVILFTSPAGGTGCSSAAAAYALHQAGKGLKSLYLNLELLGNADLFFSGQGQFGMNDIIYAVKSKRGNLALKLESNVKKDENGVFFFSPADLVLNRMELNDEEILQVIGELRGSGKYDVIVLDVDFGLEQGDLALARLARAIVWVSNGTDAANDKLNRAYASLALLEGRGSAPLTKRLYVLYNMFVKGVGRTADQVAANGVGIFPKYVSTDTPKIIASLSGQDWFDTIK